MKRIAVVCGLLVFVVCLCCLAPAPQQNADYLRIHIRADSNEQSAQEVKYKVKAAVVEYLTPYLAYAGDKRAAEKVVRAHLRDLEQVANKVLDAEGFDYTCHAELRQENFPCRTYGNLTLQSGIYDALILNLGSGSGNNWWCVVYPPLCFVGGENNGTNGITYRSLLVEIINKFFAEHK